MTAQNDPHKVCLIHGNQQLLVEETADTLIEQRLEGREQEWNLERFNAQEILKTSGTSGINRIDDFLISCETLPMLTDRKVIRIDNFELIKKVVNKSERSPASLFFEELEKIVNNPPESLWFVFTSPAIREQDFSKPLYRSIKQNGRILKFVAYDNSAPYNWVIQRGEQKGLPLSADVARLIIDIVGNDLSDLDHELEKLSLYFWDWFSERWIAIAGHVDTSTQSVEATVNHFGIFTLMTTDQPVVKATEFAVQNIKLSPPLFFAPDTHQLTISYLITTPMDLQPDPLEVTMQIFDLYDQRVVTLLDRSPRRAGQNAELWNGLNKKGQVVVNCRYILLIILESGKEQAYGKKVITVFK